MPPRPLLFLLLPFGLASAALTVTDQPGNERAFPLATRTETAAIVTDDSDFAVVRIAAQCLAGDITRVNGHEPRIAKAADKLPRHVVLIGTLGHNAQIDRLVREERLDVSRIREKWESFVVATVENPLPGVESALVIAGSDRRGTAYGVFTLSEAIGVSPWVWWADVTPDHRDAVFISAVAHAEGPPSVKYRGIFLNDEDWGLQPWAAKTFEPETGDIGPKTYAKICELLLRLRANTLWPAMHPCTQAFNHYPRNKIVADEYAIVMGSSHAEPMLRNNVGEWDETRNGPWDYGRNRETIFKYWDDRVRENGRFENLYTVGMRGIHDSGMVGTASVRDGVARLEKIIADQRGMLARHVNPNPASVPQVFVPYKEVLTLYENGLSVPGDITLVWPDDNHGYIRRLSTSEERERPGGAGVYYHLSYWGRPEDYLWLCTTPPALIWEEMRKAWDHGARTVWIVNVGDIKPQEIGMEFFLRLAWNINAFDENAQRAFLSDWARRNFDEAHAEEIAGVLDTFYRLNFGAKPEHLNLTSFTNSYGEIAQRRGRFADLTKRVKTLSTKLPREKRDAFFETVAYPVSGAALANEMHLAPTFAERENAYAELQAETSVYNTVIAGGKWRHMMSSNPRNRPSLQKPSSDSSAAAAAADSSETSPAGYVAFEAKDSTRRTTDKGAEWKIIPGLGRTGSAIALWPTTAVIPATAALVYEFDAPGAGDIRASIQCLPTLPGRPGEALRYSVQLDDGAAQTVDIATREFSADWSRNVLRGAAIGTTTFPGVQPGRHTLTVRPLDAGLVFDRVVLDFGGVKPTQLGPPATAAR